MPKQKKEDPDEKEDKRQGKGKYGEHKHGDQETMHEPHLPFGQLRHPE
jgi:hypothetical protein